MDSDATLEKTKKIKKEAARLKKVFKNLDKNKLDTVNSLISNAAFMAVSLEELQEAINTYGYTSEYQNGENQCGTKKSPEVEIYIALSKNYAVVIKQLADLAPPAKRKESRLAAMRNQ